MYQMMLASAVGTWAMLTRALRIHSMHLAGKTEHESTTQVTNHDTANCSKQPPETHGVRVCCGESVASQILS